MDGIAEPLEQGSFDTDEDRDELERAPVNLDVGTEDSTLGAAG